MPAQGGGPTLLEVKFTRYYGHFEGDQQTYRGPNEVANARENLDCLKRFRRRVVESGRLTDAQLDQVDSQVAALIDESVAEAKAAPLPTPEDLLTDVYGTYWSRRHEGEQPIMATRKLSYRDAINEALTREMERDPSVIVMGACPWKLGQVSPE